MPDVYRLSPPDRDVAVVPLRLACCSIEIAAAIESGLLVEGAPDRRALTVLVVAGTVTEPMVEAVERAWAQLPEPRTVLAFGACASSGGPYWDAPSVVPGIDRQVAVHRYVPGCPPRPQALVEAIERLADEVAG